MNIKLIIFDLDGVLVEAKQIHYDALNKNYRFDITRHVNEILAEKIINDTIKIIPNGNGITANRVVLNGINSTKKDKAKIIISYSKY